jgi:dTDP-4-dehydrorhamnose reductase
LPFAIQKHVLESKAKVIQIATDCVFTGSVGNYSEGDFHDEVDTYGRTKSLGEVSSSNFMHIRVSIIGPELCGHTSLYDWVRMQPHGAKIRGFVNHFWNGIPALHFAKISRAIIEKELFLPGLLHLVPADSVSKKELVTLIADHLGRHDLEIVPFETAQGVNRVLTTENPAISLGLWQAIGYREAPSIRQLVAEI